MQGIDRDDIVQALAGLAAARPARPFEFLANHFTKLAEADERFFDWNFESNDANLKWLSGSFGRPVRRAEIEEMPGAGGNSGEVRRIRLTYGDDGSAESVILKTYNKKNWDRSKGMGLAREGKFYGALAWVMDARDIARPLYGAGSWSTGNKVMILEDLGEYTQSGYFFGDTSPLNWGKDLPAIVEKAGNPSTESIITEAFTLAARMHARFWMDRSLLHLNWLRSSDWLAGRGKESWLTAQNYGIDQWTTAKSRIASGECDVKFNPDLIATIDAAQAKIDWDVYQEKVQNKGGWTLVHGDFHPANFMWHKTGGLKLVDWEMVGFGYGPQDLAQYLISHAAPALRRKIEFPALRAYLQELNSRRTDGGAPYTWEECWNEYKFGGAERWFWLLPILCQMCPAKMVQRFHDQVNAYCIDHGINAQTTGMQRV